MQQLLKDLKGIDGLIIQEDRPLAPLTTMKVGGAARCFVRPTSIKCLERLLNYLLSRQVPYKILGNGSNLIVSDKGVGVVVCLSRLKKINKISENTLYVEAGCTISEFLNWCIKKGFSGIEPLAGIPGSLGGALFMNAGANGVSIGEFVEELCVTTACGSSWIKTSRDSFGYRKSSIPGGGIVSAARFRLREERKVKRPFEDAGRGLSAMVPAQPNFVLSNIKETMKKRLSTQPLGRPSAGCIFKNPSKSVSAWALIASCGLQGKRFRDAQVSEKHANFIVNLGRASSADILSLMGMVKKRVWEETGVVLKEEVIVWNHEKHHL